jgi:hypothetical protein
MSSELLTCTSRDCPKRTGGAFIIAATVADRLSADEALFLSESNSIEDLWDTAALPQAIEAWEYLKTAEQLTPAVIGRMHSILMRNQDLLPVDRSAFRTCSVWVGGWEGRHWYAVQAMIEQWVIYANDIVTIPADSTTETTANAEETAADQPVVPVEPAAPDAPVGESGQPEAQVAPDAAAPAEQQPQQ